MLAAQPSLKTGYRPDIDGLRAIAILSVLGFHLSPAYVKSGFVGVDIFFVISGFLITGILLDKHAEHNFSFVGFYQRRIRRIFPALVVVLLSTLIAGWFIAAPNVFKMLGTHTAATAGFYSNFVFWREAGYFDYTAASKPLQHMWSLAIEEQFYIAWPLLIWLTARRKFYWLALCAVLLCLSFGFNVKLSYRDAVADFYSPFARFWELMLGSMLAYLTRYDTSEFFKTNEGANLALRNGLSFLGLGLCLSIIFYKIPINHFPGWWALAPTLGAVMMIAAGPETWINRHLLSNKLMVGIGLISYPLYLWHWPLFSFTTLTAHDKTPLLLLSLFALSVGLATITYFVIEKPLRFGAHGGAKTLVLGAAMIALGGTGYFIDKHNGLPDRFPPLLQEIVTYRVNHTDDWRAGTCFMDKEDETHFKECAHNPTKGKPAATYLLWGDSMAASIYKGFEQVLGSKNRLIQMATRTCPPMIGFQTPDNPNCEKINAFVFKRIQKEKPDYVVLSAAWHRYDDRSQLSATLKQLKEAGVPHIKVIGPPPEWKGTIQDITYNFYRTDPEHRLLKRMDYRFVSAQNDVEKELKAATKKAGVTYISPAQTFCNAEGCLARLGDRADTLTSWDSLHLTTAASRYLVEQHRKEFK